MEPNFFIVGAPKAGTTSLYHYLDQHPQIYMSPIKEPSFFASELRPENFHPRLREQALRERENIRQYLAGPMTEKRFGGPVEDWESYRSLYRNARSEAAIGEASASYLWSPSAAANIAEKIPAARIVMILRDPSERAYSQYLGALNDGLIRHSFREQLRRAGGGASNGAGAQFDVLNPLLEFGMYSQQVERYFQAFPQGRVKIYLYEEYRDRPAETLQDLFGFLGVDANFQPDFSRRMMEPHVPHSVTAAYFLKRSGLWRQAKKWSPPPLQRALRASIFRKRSSLALDPEDRRTLQQYYREDILRLSARIGRDLGAWLA